MALMAAIASIAPLGAAAADSAATTPATTIIAPEASPQVVARRTDVARDQQLSQAEHYAGILNPQTSAELKAYWQRVNPMLLGG